MFVFNKLNLLIMIAMSFFYSNYAQAGSNETSHASRKSQSLVSNIDDKPNIEQQSKITTDEKSQLNKQVNDQNSINDPQVYIENSPLKPTSNSQELPTNFKNDLNIEVESKEITHNIHEKPNFINEPIDLASNAQLVELSLEHKEESELNEEMLNYSELDIESLVSLNDLLNSSYMEQLVSPNLMYRRIKSEQTIYIDPDLGFNNYTFGGYSEVISKPEFGILEQESDRITYVMKDLSSLMRKNKISPLYDTFTIAKQEIDEHLIQTRSEIKVTVYFSFDPLSIKQWYIKNHGLDTYEVSTHNYDQGLFPRLGYGSEGEPSLDLNILPVWQEGITGKGVDVAIFDTGVDPNNPDLVNKLDMNKAQDLSGYLYPIDFTNGNSHGTRVAGIVGAEAKNLLGVRGIAYDANLIPIIPNYRDIYSLNYSFPYYIEPTKNLIISSSIGAEPGSIDNFMNENDQFDKNAIAKYLSKNVVINQSIGNYYSAWYREQEKNKNKKKFYYTGCRFYNVGCQFSQISSLGLAPIVNGIAAVDSNGHHSYYSNSSSSNLVSAFGGTRNDIKDGLLNYSRGIMTTDLSGLTNGTTGIYCNLLSDGSFLRQFCDGSINENSNGDYTSEMNGTSAATPMISAIVALMRQANSKLTWADVRDILIKSSSHDKLASYMATSDLYNLWFEDGANLIIEDEAIINGAGYKFSNLYGFGLIDAHKAVTMARSYKVGNLKKINEQYLKPIILNLSKLTFKAADKVADAMSISTIKAKSKIKLSSVALVISPELFTKFMDDPNSCDDLIAYYRAGSYYENNYLNEHCRNSDLTFTQIEIISPAGTKSILKGLGSIVTYVIDPKHPWELFTNAFYGEDSYGNWQVRIITSKGERIMKLTSEKQELVITKNRSYDQEINVPAKLKLFPLVSGER